MNEDLGLLLQWLNGKKVIVDDVVYIFPHGTPKLRRILENYLKSK